MSLARNAPALTPLPANADAGYGPITVVEAAGKVGSADQRKASCVIAEELTENLHET